jgi:hypothetical protein
MTTARGGDRSRVHSVRGLRGSGSGSAVLEVEVVSFYYGINVFWKIKNPFGSNQSRSLQNPRYKLFYKIEVNLTIKYLRPLIVVSDSDRTRAGAQ